MVRSELSDPAVKITAGIAAVRAQRGGVAREAPESEDWGDTARKALQRKRKKMPRVLLYLRPSRCCPTLTVRPKSPSPSWEVLLICIHIKTRLSSLLRF